MSAGIRMGAGACPITEGRSGERMSDLSFESMTELKQSILRGGEIQFLYQGVGYAITHPGGHHNISKYERPDTELESDDVEAILDYRMDDGKKLREVIHEIEVEARTL